MLIVVLAIFGRLYLPKLWLHLLHSLIVLTGQFHPKSGGQFHAESVVSLNRNRVVSFSEISIPINHPVYGTCKIQNQRLMLDIRNIRLGNAILPVNLTVFDLDGMPGISVPEALMREAVNGGAGDAISNLQLLSLESSPTAQIAGAGIQAAKGLLQKKVKRIKVKLQSGYPVLLRDNDRK